MIREKIVNINGTDYIVSSDGKLYSTKNIGRGKYHKEISQRKDTDGYYRVTVGNNKHRVAMRVHKIVARAFLENYDDTLEVDHIDNDKANNDISNLQCITAFENKSKIPFITRSESHKGEKNGRAKLTEADVRNIRQLFKDGYTVQQIATSYSRGWSTINNIIQGNTWREVR